MQVLNKDQFSRLKQIHKVKFKGEYNDQYAIFRASQEALVVNNSLANAGDGLGFDPWLGKISWSRFQATFSSIFAQKNAWTEETDGLQSMGL